MRGETTVAIGDEGSNCLVGKGMDEIRSDFSQWDEDKETMVHSGVWEDQPTVMHHLLVIEKEIEIKRPVKGTYPIGDPFAAMPSFNCMEMTQQSMGCQPGLDQARGIDEPVDTDHVHGLGEIWARQGKGGDFGMCQQFPPSRLKRS